MRLHQRNHAASDLNKGETHRNVETIKSGTVADLCMDCLSKCAGDCFVGGIESHPKTYWKSIPVIGFVVFYVMVTETGNHEVCKPPGIPHSRVVAFITFDMQIGY